MRRSIVVWPLIAACVAGCGDSEGGPPPSADAVAPAVRAYLLAERQRGCRGSVRLDSLDVTGVGSYESNMRGYPVYARFATTCQQGRDSLTFNGRDPNSKAAAAYVRRTAGGVWEGYMPEIFRMGQARAQQQVEELMKKMQPKP